jgi:hypothetical protein
MRILLALVVACCGCEAIDDFTRFHVVGDDSGDQHDAAVGADGGGQHDAFAPDLVGVPDLATPDLAMPDLLFPPPILNSISPSLAPSTGGTQLTLSGVGFVQGAKVTVAGDDAHGVWVSATQMIATLPAKPGTRGKVAVSVTNPDTQSVTRADLFTYYPGALTFAAPVNYGVAANARGITSGDWNGDGHLDLAAAVDGPDGVTVLSGKGDGTFHVGNTYSTGVGTAPFTVATADFNRDNKPDLAVVNQHGNSVSLFLGNGDGTFQPPAGTCGTGTGPGGLVTGKWNGDQVDLAVANWGDNNVSILMGNGNGGCQSPVNYSAGVSPAGIATGDWNGDGKLDLATANYGNNDPAHGGVSVLLGTGNGTPGATFPSHVEYFITNGCPNSIASGDFNGDGKADLAVADQCVAMVSVLLGNGDGTFRAHVDYAAGATPNSITVLDVDGDGKIDVVVANQGDNNVAVLLGKGDGTLSSASTFATDKAPSGLTVGDWNGDGKIDLATANAANSNDVSVLINTSQ